MFVFSERTRQSAGCVPAAKRHGRAAQATGLGRMRHESADPFRGTGPGHDFGRIAMRSRQEREGASHAPAAFPGRQSALRCAESPGPGAPDKEHLHAQSGGAGSGGGAAGGGAGAAATPSASLSIASAGYSDSATESKKKVTFNATWSGGAKEDYVLVQQLKGSIKKPDGTPLKVTMYGSDVDFNFADYQVDSLDADPAYWSAGGTRWKYTVGGANKFSATDAPGPMKTSYGVGAKAHVDFKIAVYKSADVPATTTGAIAATPLSSMHTWSFHANVLAGGKFNHDTT